MTGSIDLGIEGIADGEEIGRGGFGTVFRARQVKVGRVVAVKVLSAVSLSDETLRRFERECRAMAAVSSHPHITALYDSGVSSSGRPYIVMEHVAGGSLAPRLPLPWPDAVEIGVKVAGALETAHRIGIYHRDVKPENILVSAYGEPMLADFGVAKVADSSETPSGNITASLLHAAPETLSGARPSASTDVYSLASTVFTLIAGHAPFAAQHDEESLAPLITRIATAQVPDLRPDGVPDVVCAVLERGMAKEPGMRPGSPEAFGEQLREAQVACGLAPTEMLIEGRDRAPSGAFPLPVDPDDQTTISRSRSQVVPVLLTAAAAGAPGSPGAPWWRRRVPTVAAGVVAVLLLAGSAFGVTQLRSDDDPIVAMQTSDREDVEDDGVTADDEQPSGSPTAAPGVTTAPADGSAPVPPVGGGDDGSSLIGGGVTGDSGGAASTGGSGGGTVTQQPSTSTDTTATTQQTTQPVSPPKTTTAPVAVPAAPASVRSRDVRVETRKGGYSTAAAETVSVATTWAAVSGATQYCVRFTVMTGSSTVNQGPFNGGCTVGTSLRVTVNAVAPADSWMRWEVQARNSAGSSAWSRAAAIVPDMVPGTSYDATQQLRAAGMRPGYGCLGAPPSGRSEYEMVRQDTAAGSVVSGGTSVRIHFYETGC